MGYGITPDRLIITVAQTGAITNDKLNPNVPEQPEEIAGSAYACFNEGAAICHVHARDKTGENTAEISIFHDIHDRIRQKCNIVIQDSTGGGPNLSQDERINCLKTQPEMEVYNHAMLQEVRRLIKEGLVSRPYYINIVLGMRYQGAEPATPATFISMVQNLPPDSIFNCTGVGEAQTSLGAISMVLARMGPSIARRST